LIILKNENLPIHFKFKALAKFSIDEYVLPVIRVAAAINMFPAGYFPIKGWEHQVKLWLFRHVKKTFRQDPSI